MKNPGFRFDGSGKSFQTESVERHVAEGLKAPGGPHIRNGATHTKRLTNPAEHREGVKNRDADGYERTHPNAFGRKIPRTSSGSRARKPVAEGRKVGGDDFFQNGSDHMIERGGPGTTARKAASAKIAKIPFALSSWIAKCYLPKRIAA